MVAGTFDGTGAAIYVGIGFQPDWVRIYNLESSTNQLHIEWSSQFRSAEMLEGLRYTETIAGGNITAARLTFGAGVRRYPGGDKMTSSSTAYLKRDSKDYRTSVAYGTIDTWTLDTPATPTGHWNVEVDTTYVGEGSPITIVETLTGLVKRVFITALTSNGEVTDEVTLSEAVKSGKIVHIGRMYDWVGCASGDVTSAGFQSADTTVNVSGNICMFEAGSYDNQ